jgi:biotin carboxylase
MKKCILIIGVRRQCYKAAMKLGHDVVLWCDGELNDNRKKGLIGFIEEPYSESASKLNSSVIEQLKKYKIQRVMANTEETVILGALVREHLNLKRIAVDVTQRFHDKLVMKDFATKYNIPITKYKIIEAGTTPEELSEYLGFPLVIKPVDESGAQDVKIAHTIEDVNKFMQVGLLAEAFVKGSEVSVETFVQDGKVVFHNITEYLHQWRKSVVPAQLEEDLKSKILKMNDKIIEKFGVDRGMTHAEFYLTNEGPVFGEIAIRPPGGYYMDLIEKVYGFSSWELYVNLSCGDDISNFNVNQSGCAAVYMIHPGAGKVVSISGVDKIKENVKGLFHFSLRREPGDIILAHENTSNEVGHIFFWAKDREQLNKDFEYIDSTLKFELEIN